MAYSVFFFLSILCTCNCKSSLPLSDVFLNTDVRMCQSSSFLRLFGRHGKNSRHNSSGKVWGSCVQIFLSEVVAAAVFKQDVKNPLSRRTLWPAVVNILASLFCLFIYIYRLPTPQTYINVFSMPVCGGWYSSIGLITASWCKLCQYHSVCLDHQPILACDVHCVQNGFDNV